MSLLKLVGLALFGKSSDDYDAHEYHDDPKDDDHDYCRHEDYCPTCHDDYYGNDGCYDHDDDDDGDDYDDYDDD